MREAVAPDRAYLLLDGISGGNHGHWDGNSILRFTDNGRMWLCEGDYLKGDPKDHNTVTVMRDAEGGSPQTIVELRAAHAASEWAVIVTRTPNYQGLNWDRHITWHRPSDTFLMLDRFTALKSGAYDVTSRFRSLGETDLTDRVWTVTQAGDERFFIHAPGDGRLTEGSVPDDAKNWERYAHAEPTPRLFMHRVTRDLEPGESMIIPNIFYAAGPGASPRIQASVTASNNLASKGALSVAVFGGPTATENFSADAVNCLISPNHCLLIGMTSFTTADCALRTPQPVTLNIDVAKQLVEVTSATSGQLEIDCGATVSRIAFTRGTGKLEKIPRDLFAALGSLHERLAKRPPLPPARDVAEKSTPAHVLSEVATVPLPASGTCLLDVDLNGDGTPEWLIGCANGALIAADANGKTLWTHTFTGAVNALAVTDLDGDKRPEIACAVEDSHLHVLNADGTERWREFFDAYRATGGIEGHPRVVVARDFDGDGTPEIAVGCANSMFYVLNADGTRKSGATGPWEITMRHKASAIDAAEMTGDGLLELLCGFTYFSRRIVDFAKSGYDRQSALGGCISGCMAITHADFDLDGRAEAAFADKDGRVTVCKPWREKRLTTVVLWSRIIGDDAHVRTLAADLIGDSRPELVLASRSGFLALLDNAGNVVWTRYARDAVTDADLLAGHDRPAVLIRTSRDGELAVFAPNGDQMASWRQPDPIVKAAAARTAAADHIGILTRDTFRLLKLAPR